MTRVVLRFVAVCVAACVALLVGATPALAHTRLESSDPADGSSVSTGPDSVSLTFNENIQSQFATVTVVGPDGTNYQVGQATGDGEQVRTAVSPIGPAGTYSVGYRVLSDDGHPVTGKVAFTLTTPGLAAVPTTAAGSKAAAAPPATPAVAPQATTQQSDGALVWPWLLGALVLVGAAAAAALRFARRS